MKLAEIRNKYRGDGMSELNAQARACQDAIVAKIAASSMRKNTTIKGGVLMCAISKDSRRATQDFDLDFVRYPITDSAIKAFVKALNSVDDGISIKLFGKIEELSQHDYKGKRIYVRLTDGASSFETKIDLGVHASLEMEQVECLFDIAQNDEGVSLLANSKEQMFTEKLTSLLRHGIRSTRFRDLYDMYYIGHMKTLDRQKLNEYLRIAIIDNDDMWDNNMEDIAARLNRTLTNKQFLARMKTSHRDWLGKSVNEVTDWLPSFLLQL